MAKIGYARVSTAEQNASIQEAALKAAGCDRVVTETGSGADGERPGLRALVAELQPDDVLVAWKIDRLARSTRDLLALADELESKGVGLAITTTPIDTTSSAGRLFVTMLAAVAEFERELIRERVQAGVAKAKAKGTHCGRPAMNKAKIETAKALIAQGWSKSAAAKQAGVGRATLYRYL